MENENKALQYFVLICKNTKQKKFYEILQEYGAKNINTVSAHGSVSKSILLSAFGLESTDKKLMMCTLLPYCKASELIKVLYNEYEFNKPNTGIAYTIPVEGLLF